MKDYCKRAKEIIADRDYITIATVTSDGLPWNSPVYSAFDENYNFYFGTHDGSQKAQNIALNPNVFLVIYDSTVPPGTGEGVYVQGKAEQISNLEDIKRAHKILADRRPTEFWPIEAVSGDGPVRLYKISPEKVWMNSDGEKNGFYIDTRTEVYLKTNG